MVRAAGDAILLLLLLESGRKQAAIGAHACMGGLPSNKLLLSLDCIHGGPHAKGKAHSRANLSKLKRMARKKTEIGHPERGRLILRLYGVVSGDHPC